MGLHLSFHLERSITVPESWFVMWTNDNSFGNRNNTYYNQSSFFTFSALFAIENSQMFNASTSYIISLSILIKSLLSFAFCRNPLYMQRPYEQNFSFCSFESAVLSPKCPSSQFTHPVSLSVAKSNCVDEMHHYR